MPLVHSVPMHFVLFPLTIITHHLGIIRKFSSTLEFSVFKLSFVNASLTEFVQTFWSIFTVLVLSFIVRRSIRPIFFTLTIFLIVEESSIIGITLLAWFSQLTMALGVSVDECTLQNTQVFSKSFLSFSIR